MRIVRGRIVGLRIRSCTGLERRGGDSRSHVHAELYVGIELGISIEFQLVRLYDACFVGPGTGSDVHGALVFGRIGHRSFGEYLGLVERFERDDAAAPGAARTCDLQDRRNSSSHLRGRDDRDLGQQSGHDRRQL